MTMTKSRWRGPGGRAALLVLAAALIPLPVAASEAAPAHTTPAATTSLHQAVAREAARAAAEAPKPAATTAARADQGSSKGMMGFLKSRPGMIALTVMVVGTGYAIYSAQHDRIKSPGRQ